MTPGTGDRVRITSACRSFAGLTGVVTAYDEVAQKPGFLAWEVLLDPDADLGPGTASEPVWFSQHELEVLE